MRKQWFDGLGIPMVVGFCCWGGLLVSFCRFVVESMTVCVRVRFFSMEFLRSIGSMRNFVLRWWSWSMTESSIE